MTDPLTPDDAEARLRRTFASRAEDMAAGDDAPWDPHLVHDALTLAPLPDGEGRQPRPSRRLLVAGIAAVTLPVLAGAAYLANRDTPTKTIGSPGGSPCESTTTTTDQAWTEPPTTWPATTEPPTTTTVLPGTTSSTVGTVPGDGTTTTAPTVPTTSSTTTPPTVPTTGGGSSTTQLPRPFIRQAPCDGTTSSSAPAPAPTDECIVVGVGDERGWVGATGEGAAAAQFDVAVHEVDGEGLSTYPGAVPITAGDHQGSYATIQDGDGSLGAVELVLGRYTVVIQGRHITRDQNVAIAASVQETGEAGTFTFTPLPGFVADVC